MGIRFLLSVLSLGPCLLSERGYLGYMRLLLKLQGGAERRDWLGVLNSSRPTNLFAALMSRLGGKGSPCSGVCGPCKGLCARNSEQGGTASPGAPSRTRPGPRRDCTVGEVSPLGILVSVLGASL